uniref:WGS project CAEQ00000000 data, annotated contig 317 n=1 Tax=Trypanosoma congolense (strain IL3000) TaxID=1068625 RepID=F9WEV5_TRYCI|nr:unnamed protein product [Trypanosoma congolense IL3000]
MSPGEGTCISISIYRYIDMHVLLCKYNGNNILLLYFSPFFSQYNFCASFPHFHFFLCFCCCRYRVTLVSATHGSVRGPGVLHAVDERVLTPSKRCPPARVELPKGVFFKCVWEGTSFHFRLPPTVSHEASFVTRCGDTNEVHCGRKGVSHLLVTGTVGAPVVTEV